MTFEKIPLNRHSLIEASAGTGKTYTLENFILRVLTTPDKHGNYLSLKSILVTTFSNKAAHELKSRIRSILNRSLLSEVQQYGNDKKLSTHLKQCIQSMDEAWIGTIHSFCHRALKEYPFESAFDTGWQLNPSRSLVKKSLRKLWFQKWQKQFTSPKDFEEFLSSIDQEPDSLLQYLEEILFDYHPEKLDILQPEFKPDTLQKLLNRCIENLAQIDQKFPDLKKLDGMAFVESYKKSFSIQGNSLVSCKKMLPSFIGLLQALANPNPTSWEKLLTQWKENLKNSVEEKLHVHAIFGPDGKLDTPTIWNYLNQHVTIHADELSKHLVNLVTGLMDYKYQETVHPNFKILQQWIAEALAEIQGEKERQASGSYDDILLYFNKALQNQNSSLKQIFQNKFSFCLIDESQDISPLHWKIFKNLFLKSNTHLILVGDPKQSIYSFQGSDLNSYFLAKNQILEAGGALHRLEKNWRTDRTLLESVERLFLRHQWFIDPQITYTSLETEDPKSFPQSVFEYIDLSPFPVVSTKRLRLAQTIASDILSRIKVGTAYEDIAILTETHSESKLFRKVLKKFGIPSQHFKRRELFGSEACLHLIHVLESLVDSRNYSRKIKALLTPYFKGSNYLESIFLPQENSYHDDNWEKCLEWVERKKWGKFFYFLSENSNLVNHLEEDSEFPELAAYQSIHQKTLAQIQQNKLSIQECILWLRSLYTKQIDVSEDQDQFPVEKKSAVQILTIFVSKGLEFKEVYVCSGLKIPSKQSKIKKWSHPLGGRIFHLDPKYPNAKVNLEEYRTKEYARLYYVAFTRSKHRLVMPLWDRDYTNTLKKSYSKSPYYTVWAEPLIALVNEGIPKEIPVVKGTSNGLVSRLHSTDKSQSDPLNSFIQKNCQDTASAQPVLSENSKLPKQFRYRHWQSFSSLSRKSEKGQVESPEEESITIESEIRIESILSTLSSLPISPTIPTLPTQKNQEQPSSSIIEATLLPPGPETGNVLHQMLENWVFPMYPEVSSLDEIENHPEWQRIAQTILPSSWDVLRRKACVEILANLCQTSIHTPFGNFKLKESRFQWNEAYFLQSSLLPSQFLNGYIDGIFLWQDRYFIVDYKSNYLDDYTLPALAKDMEKHDYHLQMKVYAVCLHHFLSNHPAPYRFSVHFGGIVYLYLRGLRLGTQEGIYTYFPTEEEVSHIWPTQLREKMVYD